MNYIDLHQDIAGAQSHPQLRSQTSFELLATAKAKIVFGTGFTLPEESLVDVVSRDLDFYDEQCTRNPEWKLLKTRHDVRTVIKSSDGHGVIFHIEGFPGFEGDWSVLDMWYERGLRSVGLVWNDDNPLGGGTNSTVGITELGREFIKRCEAKQILIDLAHTNPVMFADCLTVTERAPFISHGALFSLVPNKRNYTDVQLFEVVRRGGIVGIFLAKSALATSANFDVRDVALHIKRAIELLGNDAVALGTDFGGMIYGTPQHLTCVADIPNLWAALQDVGLSDVQIHNIAAGNAQRYLEQNLPL